MQKNNIFNQAKGAAREPQRFAIQESRLSRIIRNCAVLLVLAMIWIILPASVMAFTDGKKEQKKASVSLETVFLDLGHSSKRVPGAIIKLVNTTTCEEYFFVTPEEGRVLERVQLPLGTYEYVLVFLPLDSEVFNGKKYDYTKERKQLIGDADTVYDLKFELLEDGMILNPIPPAEDGMILNPIPPAIDPISVHLIFDKGAHGTLEDGTDGGLKTKEYIVKGGTTIADIKSYMPRVVPEAGYTHIGWNLKIQEPESDFPKLDGLQVSLDTDYLDGYVLNAKRVIFEAIYLAEDSSDSVKVAFNTNIGLWGNMKARANEGLASNGTKDHEVKKGKTIAQAKSEDPSFTPKVVEDPRYILMGWQVKTKDSVSYITPNLLDAYVFTQDVTFNAIYFKKSSAESYLKDSDFCKDTKRNTVRVTFEDGDHGTLKVGTSVNLSTKAYYVVQGQTIAGVKYLVPSFIPTVIPDQGYIHRGWKVIAKSSDLDGRQVYPNLDGLDDYVFTENLTLEAIYSEVNTVSDSPVNPIYLDWDQIKDLVSEPTVEVKVTPATPSLTPERKALPVTGESRTGSYVAGLSLLSLGLILLVIRRANRP